MARNRTPLDKAEVSGRTQHDPGRYKDRTKITGSRPLGEPYVRMTDAEKEAWADLKANIPWLKASHRQIVRLACVHLAKLDEGTLSVTGIRSLTGILAKLGATPVDECRIFHQQSEEDPDEEFFSVH